ncbi:hypothetical protein GCM10023346_07400 [Arthrobacter gyeryongensis]|uniref:Uncharacterized protein n=1 Tax=Arthrobacter gyeryongensis TaxID=1650592 RepID=A0ABP9S3I5_9MICC
MKLESTQQRRPEDDSRKDSDGLDQKKDKSRHEPNSSNQSRLPDPPDPDNLPIDYPGLRDIEWP